MIKRRCKMNSTICTFAIFQYKLHKPRLKFKLFADNLHIHIQWTAADRVSLNHFDSWTNHSDRNGFKERSEPLFTVKYMRKVNKMTNFHFWANKHTSPATKKSSGVSSSFALYLAMIFSAIGWMSSLAGSSSPSSSASKREVKNSEIREEDDEWA